MESLGTGCKEAFLLPVPVPSDSIAGHPRTFFKGKKQYR